MSIGHVTSINTSDQIDVYMYPNNVNMMQP